MKTEKAALKVLPKAAPKLNELKTFDTSQKKPRSGGDGSGNFEARHVGS